MIIVQIIGRDLKASPNSERETNDEFGKKGSGELSISGEESPAVRSIKRTVYLNGYVPFFVSIIFEHSLFASICRKRNYIFCIQPSVG